jgi:3-phenylpropionate/trans-cinnamate dioxygenase ferredoxin reductase subunit
MRIVVVGGGQAAAALVARLRALGHRGPITLIGAERVLPYQRPPLSKAYLMGEIGVERLILRAEEYYVEQGVTLRLGQPVTAIDRAARVAWIGAEPVPYDALVLTTGAVPRRLPAAMGGALPGVYTLRDIADVDAMRGAFRPGARLVVVGGGYIGLEAAAVARKLGLEVTVVEMAPRILQRVAAAQTSDWFRALHARHGVTILEQTALARLSGDGHVARAELADGRVLPCDFVIVGAGIAPATALAEAAGLALDNGIAVDDLGRTSDPAIWAAGDCASFPQAGGRLRLESVGNAIDMGEAVAANLLGAGAPYVAKPWFWSDQYEAKLQIAGLNTGYDRVVTRRTSDDQVAFWYFAGDRLLAVDAIGDARAYMVGKRLIENGRSPDPAVLADAAADLRPLLRA